MIIRCFVTSNSRKPWRSSLHFVSWGKGGLIIFPCSSPCGRKNVEIPSERIKCDECDEFNS